MQALVYVAPQTLEFHEQPDPKISGPREALVRPIAATPCDLDRAIVFGKTPLMPPFSLGHECVAEIVAVGDAVTQLSVGQRVVVAWHLSCGECTRCRRGLTASCERVPPRAMYGTPIGGEFGGLFSDLVHVPFAEAMLTPLPAGLDPARVASASDNLTDAYLAVARPLQQQPGAPVLVVGGVGAIGLYAVEAARALGASEVVYLDRSEARLTLAAELGARAQADTSEEFPVVIEASGRPEDLHRALRAVAPGGTCHALGIYFLDTPLPLLDMYAKDVTFRTGRPSVGPHIGRVLGLCAEGRLRPERISNRVVPWNQMIETLLDRAARKPIFTR
jgi:threonine dehydrogenase-like Zn-dependent dehydrogenase